MTESQGFARVKPQAATPGGLASGSHDTAEKLQAKFEEGDMRRDIRGMKAVNRAVPARNAARMLDLLGGAYGMGGAEATMDPRSSAWQPTGQAESDPIIPGTLLLEALLHLAGELAVARGSTGRARTFALRDVRFLKEARVAAGPFKCHIDAKRLSPGGQLIEADGYVLSGGQICLWVEEITMVSLTM